MPPRTPRAASLLFVALTLFFAAYQPPSAIVSATRRQAAVPQSNPDGAMHGVTPGRTNAFNTRALSEPTNLAWVTGRLFVMKEVRHLVGESGPIRLAFDLPTGHHYTAPVFARGALYLTAYIGDGYLFALDAATGRELWRYKAKGTYLSPPAVAGDSVFVAASDGNLHAFDAATGRPRWNTKRKGDSLAPTAPLVANGHLYLSAGDGELGDAVLVAVDAGTGEEKWVYKTKGLPSAPALEGGALYFGSHRGDLFAVDAATGRELWKSRAGRGVATPVASGGLVFFTTEGGELNCVDATTGQRRWKAEKTGKVNTPLAVSGGLVYFGGREGGLFAVDAQTGAERWQLKTPAPCRTPVVAGPVLYVPVGDALAAADAATGQLKWAYRNKAQLRVPPAVADGVLYYLDDNGQMYALK